MLSVIPIRAFNDNYIWMLQVDGDACVFVVDPGDAGPVLATLEANNLTLVGILVTHHHPDHTGGILQLLDRFDVPVIGPQNAAIRGITRYVKEGEQVDVLGCTFQVMEIPGHTLDHIAFFCDHPQQPLLFCGDTLFVAGCGRLFEGTAQQMYTSLTKLAALSNGTQVYCAHEYTLGNLQFALAVEPENNSLKSHIQVCRELREKNIPTVPSTIGKELQFNPFLRSDRQSVKAAAQSYSGESLASAVDVFRVIRGWKDHF